MKAAIRRKYGSPNAITIETIDQPVPKDDEVLIQVYASSVNRTDCANLTAKPFIMRFVLGLFRPRKIILGTDFAGEVVAIGKNVQTFKPGDQVFGFTDTGSESQAEFLVTTIDHIFPMPTNLDYQHAAASLEGAHYTFTIIKKVNIEPGQHILINGATGGIGSALLQMVRQYKVSITVTCNTKNISLMESLGADRTIDYTQKDFTQVDGQYDFILDAVGKSSFGKCKGLLKDKGVYVSSELGPYNQNLFYPLLTKWSGKQVIFPVPFHKKESIPYISDLLQTGNYLPVIDREYPLKDIAQAYEYVLKGQKTGSVVINISTT